MLASATVATPAESAGRLTGVPVEEVTEDASPRGATAFALWEPPLTGRPRRARSAGPPVRRRRGRPAARRPGGGGRPSARLRPLPARRRGGRPDRRAAIWRTARRELVDRVAAYRAGYLPEERRALEAALANGTLLGVAATNALELGVDIAGLDAVVLAGFPGTLASLWQQAGRAGREGLGALVVFVARDDPLDTYLVHHPEAVFGRPVEATVLDPENPYVLGPQLCCAAAELALTEADLPLFGGPVAEAVLPDLVRRGLLRHRPTGWYWTDRRRPDLDIRGTGGEPVRVVEAAHRPGARHRRRLGVRTRPCTRAPSTCTRGCPTWWTSLT